jgi:hypothetical protein
MRTSIAKLVAAFAMVAAMVGCASTGGEQHLNSANDVVYDSPFQIG